MTRSPRFTTLPKLRGRLITVYLSQSRGASNGYHVLRIVAVRYDLKLRSVVHIVARMFDPVTGKYTGKKLKLTDPREYEKPGLCGLISRRNGREQYLSIQEVVRKNPSKYQDATPATPAPPLEPAAMPAYLLPAHEARPSLPLPPLLHRQPFVPDVDAVTLAACDKWLAANRGKLRAELPLEPAWKIKLPDKSVLHLVELRERSQDGDGVLIVDAYQSPGSSDIHRRGDIPYLEAQASLEALARVKAKTPAPAETSGPKKPTKPDTTRKPATSSPQEHQATVKPEPATEPTDSPPITDDDDPFGVL